MTATVPDLDAPELAAPLHPAANPEELALLAWAAANPIDRPSPPMSGGRYRLPHPESGKVRSWTRISTLAKTLDDSTGLEIWRNRLIVAGLKARPDLLANVDPADKASLTTAANAAALHGGDKLKADLGTAMHTALEHLVLDTGLLPPAPYIDDVLAIAEAFERAGLTFPQDLVEATLVAPAYDAVGRTDLVAAGPWGDTLRISDLKTGTLQNVAAAAQLAGYAKASHRWTPDGYVPCENIDQAVGLLIHAPLGTATCTIYELDLITGAEIADLCIVVRKRRNGAKALITRLVSVEPEVLVAADVPAGTDTEPVAEAEKVADVLPAAVNDMRAQAIKARLKNVDAAQREEVVRGWPEGTPTKPPWTFDQATALEAHLYAFDGIEAPFLPDPDAPDPVVLTPIDETEDITTAPTWPTPDDGGPAPDGAAEAVRAAAKKLAQPERDIAKAWGTEAKRQGRPWGSVAAGTMTERTLAVNTAGLRCLHAFGTDEAKTRRAIEFALGIDVAPSWRTGAIFGSLSIAEATALEELAALYLAGDAPTRNVLDAA